MKRVKILVEGQTEEAFVNELLVPHYARIGIYLTPIIASTSPGHKGGVVSYGQVRRQIERLCRQDETALITTMFDLYALPTDFPGRNADGWRQLRCGADKAAMIEQAMSLDLGLSNFLPYLQVHEFEALLFVAPEHFATWADTAVVRQLTLAIEPEAINDGPQTAPSKRIKAAMPGYQKPLHGPLIACDIGLDAMRARCPHFANWLACLDALKA